MIGIIYKYTSPVGKVYIGQTLNEEERKKSFLNGKKYAGTKINNAIKKYGPENFLYEVLEKNEYSTIDEANISLNSLETYYIILYDSVNSGYNISTGGDSLRDIMKDEDTKQRMINSLKEYYKTHDNPFKNRKHTSETKEKIRQKALGRISPLKGKHLSEKQKKILSEKAKIQCKGEGNPFYGRKHSLKTKNRIGEKNSCQVVKISKYTNEILKVYKSAKDASLDCGKKRGNSEIIKVCRNYVSPKNKHYKTAFGYKWKYLKDIEGSTTIEKDGKIYYCSE